MFKKILVANRGEIALRVIRACRELGIKSVAVYSEADEKSLHLKAADERICIGPAISAKSYLNIDSIIKAATGSGADAIHPGYGYLAEKKEFAEACEAGGIVFIGPTPENLKLAGDKITAKKIMAEAGVAVIDSGPDGVTDLDKALGMCKKIGYPVMVKASGGGGGRGIRICTDEDILREDFAVAKAEAGAAFGNEELYIEKYIENPRHIEFQILGDRSGNIAHLGERECTIQRRYQKLIEESPSPRLTTELRESMGEAAIRAAAAVKYFNAGTVEFLLDSDDNFYFMEINSRIQVEHPVTELTTGIDLVKEQIRLSAGGILDYSFDDLNKRGWAIECRINAEDPERNFLPSPGTVEVYIPPGGFGVRVDTGYAEGDEISPFYDSMVMKIICTGDDRTEAIRQSLSALGELRIDGVQHNAEFAKAMLTDPDFVKGNIYTKWIEDKLLARFMRGKS